MLISAIATAPPTSPDAILANAFWAGIKPVLPLFALVIVAGVARLALETRDLRRRIASRGVAKHQKSQVGKRRAQGAYEPIPEDIDFRVIKRPNFFTASERDFYHHLTPIADTMGCYVFSKVRLSDLFESQPGANPRHYEYYKAMHIDFVLVSKRFDTPVLAIEVDGDTHRNNEQQRLDRIKARLFKCGGMPLVRFCNGDEAHQIHEKLVDVLG